MPPLDTSDRRCYLVTKVTSGTSMYMYRTYHFGYGMFISIVFWRWMQFNADGFTGLHNWQLCAYYTHGQHMVLLPVSRQTMPTGNHHW